MAEVETRGGGDEGRDVTTLAHARGLLMATVSSVLQPMGDGWWPTSHTSVRIAACPYCGAVPAHHVGSCLQVKEIEYDSYGHVRRVVKR